MEKTYMFLVVVIEPGRKSTHYFTNCVLSKNDGSLITFEDENKERQSIDPKQCTILTNIDPVTHMARPKFGNFEFSNLKDETAKKLQEFDDQYHGAITSGDLQTFILGMNAGIQIMKDTPWYR